MRKSSSISRIAIFFAVMITIHFVTSFILQFVPSGIQPTLVHIPVVIASIIYGPRIGATLGLLTAYSHRGNTLFCLSMDAQSYWVNNSWHCRIHDQYRFCFKRDLLLLR